MSRSTTTIALAILACSGCIRETKDYPISSLNVPPNWHVATQQAKDDKTYWAEDLGDANLTSMIRESWANNPDLSAASRKMEVAREEANMAGAKLLPEADLALSGTRSKRNLVGFFPGSNNSFSTESYGLNLNVSWELDLWGKVRDSRKAAKNAWEASVQDYQAARLSLAGQVSKAWFSAIEANRQVELAEKAENTQSENASYISTRFERGLATALEQNLARATLASTRAGKARRMLQLDLATRTLETLLGRHPRGKRWTVIKLPEPKKNPPASPPSQTLEKRPDLLAGKLRLEAAGLDKTIARKNLLPSLSLVGGPGSRSREFDELLDQQFRIWSITGNLAQPIFQGGRLRANVRRAEAARMAAVDSYKAAALRAFREVEAALSAESLLKEEHDRLEEAAQASATAADLSWDRYQRGLEGIFATLESRQRAFEAESRLIALKRERLLNRIDLHIALGDQAISD